jgi:YD repeat-containing protein
VAHPITLCSRNTVDSTTYYTLDTDGSVQDLTFTYDEVGNVLTRADGLISETETFTYDNLNRLATSQVTGESTVTMAYSAAGRITSKSDVGSYTYGAGGAGPFAVTSANGSSFTYDANGYGEQSIRE